VVDVLIAYQFEGGYYCDYHKRDLLWKESAKAYASRYPVETTCVIRVNPSRPEETAFFEDDQLTAVPIAVAK